MIDSSSNAGEQDEISFLTLSHTASETVNTKSRGSQRYNFTHNRNGKNIFYYEIYTSMILQRWFILIV